VPVVVPVASNVRIVPSPVVMPRGKPGEEARIAVRVQGWDGARPPVALLTRGKVTALGVVDGEHAFEIAIRPDGPGTITQSLRLLDGDQVRAEAVVLLRVPAEMPVTPAAAESPK
jgi:hypothetical protein